MPPQNEQGEDAQLHNAILAEGDDNAAVAVANEWLREHGLAELPIPQSSTESGSERLPGKCLTTRTSRDVRLESAIGASGGANSSR